MAIDVFVGGKEGNANMKWNGFSQAEALAFLFLEGRPISQVTFWGEGKVLWFFVN